MKEIIREAIIKKFASGAISKNYLHKKKIVTMTTLNNFLLRNENISIDKLDAICKELDIKIEINHSYE